MTEQFFWGSIFKKKDWSFLSLIRRTFLESRWGQVSLPYIEFCGLSYSCFLVYLSFLSVALVYWNFKYYNYGYQIIYVNTYIIIISKILNGNSQGRGQPCLEKLLDEIQQNFAGQKVDPIFKQLLMLKSCCF